VHGVTEAFSISFAKLDEITQSVAMLLAQLAAAPIPEAFMEALPDEWKSPAIRAALRSRHFVTSGGDLSFGVMHRLMADFLRTLAGEKAPKLLERMCTVLLQVMTPDRCEDPRHWPVMRLCRPHAEALFARASAMGVTRRKRSTVYRIWRALFVRGSATDGMTLASGQVGLVAAILASAQGDRAGARWLGERVLEVSRRVLGEEHPDTLTSMNNLALTLLAEGDRAGARRLGERVLEARSRVHGEAHPDTLASMKQSGVDTPGAR